MWLAPRNAAGLDALGRSVSGPGSAQYQQFITSDAYAAEFAPTQVGRDARCVAVAGSAAAMKAAGWRPTFCTTAPPAATAST